MKIKGAKRVLVVETGSVLDEGIKSLLLREPELQVETATYANSTTFLKDIGFVYPDVIVISEAGPLDWIQTTELLHRISPQQVLRVIVIPPGGNVLEVYDKQCLQVTHNDDLISLIRH